VYPRAYPNPEASRPHLMHIESLDRYRRPSLIYTAYTNHG